MILSELSSSFHYCNTLDAGLCQTPLLLQSTAARLLTGAKNQQHWLLAHLRIDFQILLLFTFKIFSVLPHTIQPIPAVCPLTPPQVGRSFILTGFQDSFRCVFYFNTFLVFLIHLFLWLLFFKLDLSLVLIDDIFIIYLFCCGVPFESRSLLEVTMNRMEYNIKYIKIYQTTKQITINTS